MAVFDEKVMYAIYLTTNSLKISMVFVVGRFVEKLRDNARRLAETSGIGRNRGEDLRPGLFSYPVDQYVLFYCKQSDGIVLVRVIHGSRDLPSLF